MAEVIRWQDFKGDPVMQCSCGCQEFFILLDGYGDTWEHPIGTECCECGDKTIWARVEQDAAD